MDAIVIVLIAVGMAGALCCTWAYIDAQEKKRRQAAFDRGKDYMTNFMAQQGYVAGKPFPTRTVTPLPSIPIEPLPIPEYPDYQLIPDTAHLPTWTPTVSHFPDQDHGPAGHVSLPESTSQADFDVIGGDDSFDAGSCDDGGCDGDAD